MAETSYSEELQDYFKENGPQFNNLWELSLKNISPIAVVSLNIPAGEFVVEKLPNGESYYSEYTPPSHMTLKLREKTDFSVWKSLSDLRLKAFSTSTYTFDDLSTFEATLSFKRFKQGSGTDLNIVVKEISDSLKTDRLRPDTSLAVLQQGVSEAFKFYYGQSLLVDSHDHLSLAVQKQIVFDTQALLEIAGMVGGSLASRSGAKEASRVTKGVLSIASDAASVYAHVPPIPPVTIARPFPFVGINPTQTKHAIQPVTLPENYNKIPTSLRGLDKNISSVKDATVKWLNSGGLQTFSFTEESSKTFTISGMRLVSFDEYDLSYEGSEALHFNTTMSFERILSS